jgi:uncharacterized membrane protein
MNMEIQKARVQSIDLLKGIVMVIMALDHVRDYFHYSAFLFDATDPEKTTPAIYLTRWITHFCAPAFSFLAGASAFFVGKRLSKNDLSAFLLKRGLWLVFIEMTIVNFAWFFDVHFRSLGLLVIWALGISMIVLAALVHLPRKWIVGFSLLLIVGHNLLDTIHFNGNMLWSAVHEFAIYPLTPDVELAIVYPLIPWIAVMSLGYCFGSLYDSTYDAERRRRSLQLTARLALLAFVIIRYFNIYGDPKLWQEYPTVAQSLMSFFNVSKYPPSFLYLLITLGGTLLFLSFTEHAKGKLSDFFCTFGRVPFFYYILHLYVIHLLAMLFAELSGWGWQIMILSDWVTESGALKGYGFPLWVVYAVWVTVVAMLYPLCKWFDRYKQNNRQKKWLSYL